MTAQRILSAAALLLGALAAVAGSPRRSGSALDLKVLAREVNDEADHVTAVELARLIRDREPSLRIVDVRDSADYEQYHVPGAESIPLERLVTASFKSNEMIVLYSGGGAHAAQAWVFLRARGLERVFFLRGGLDEWLEEVMSPRLPSTARQGERAYIDSVAALSRYFGGTPRVVDSAVPLTTNDRDAGTSASWRASVARMRGKGC